MGVFLGGMWVVAELTGANKDPNRIASPVYGRDLGRCPQGPTVNYNEAGRFVADLTVMPQTVDCLRAAAPVGDFLDPLKPTRGAAHG